MLTNLESDVSTVTSMVKFSADGKSLCLRISTIFEMAYSPWEKYAFAFNYFKISCLGGEGSAERIHSHKVFTKLEKQFHSCTCTPWRGYLKWWLVLWPSAQSLQLAIHRLKTIQGLLYSKQVHLAFHQAAPPVLIRFILDSLCHTQPCLGFSEQECAVLCWVLSKPVLLSQL